MMDQKIDQEDAPEGRPNFRANHDGVLFVYSRERGIYEPYEHSAEDGNTERNAAGKPLGRGFREHWRKYWTVWVPIIAGIPMLIIVGFYTHYAKQQACATLQAVNEAHTSVVNARDAMERDQRAWVSVLDIKQTSDTTFTLVLVNTGKTPARDFKISAGADIGNSKGEDQSLPGKGVIAPDGKFTSYLRGNGIVTKSTQLAIHGRIDYDSVFDGSHWTAFCYRLIHPNGGVPSGFVPCDSGNEVDSNPH